MGIFFEMKKKIKPGKTRRLRFLPRVGVYVDFWGREIVLKQVPTLETAFNLVTSGLTLSNLQNIVNRQFDEIKFPARKKQKTVNTTAKVVSQKTLNAK